MLLLLGSISICHGITSFKSEYIAGNGSPCRAVQPHSSAQMQLDTACIWTRTRGRDVGKSPFH